MAITSTHPAQAPADAYSRSLLLPAMNATKTAAVEGARDRTTDFEYSEMLQQARSQQY